MASRMILARRCVAIACLVSFAAPLVARAGLYDNDAKAVTTGDLDDQDYWWTKFDMTMLDVALKQHQPEGAIGMSLASTLRRLDDLVKKYPAHEGIKAWQKRATEVNDKIDPNAPRGVSFKPGCPWDEANFGQLWVNLQWAAMKVEAKEDNDAGGLLSNVRQNLEILMRPDRLKNYPDDLRKWVEDAKPKADALAATLKSRK